MPDQKPNPQQGTPHNPTALQVPGVCETRSGATALNSTVSEAFEADPCKLKQHNHLWCESAVEAEAQYIQCVPEWPHTIAYAKNEGQNRCCHHNPKECADNAFAH